MLDIPQHWIDTGIEPALASGFHCAISGLAKELQWLDQLLRATVKTGLAFHKGALERFQQRPGLLSTENTQLHFLLLHFQLYHSRESMLELSFLPQAL